jgi:phosphomannomutase
MSAAPITFGTSGWRGIIAEDFTFSRVRLAVEAIAGNVLSQSKKPTVLVAHDTRFFSEEFARTAAIVLGEYGIRALVCRGATPTPTVAWEVRRAKLDGAINFTASHNPAEYHGLKFSDASGGPATKDVTRDIESRAAKMIGRENDLSPAGCKYGPDPSSDFPSPQRATEFEWVEPRAGYLQRLGELVRFDTIRGTYSGPGQAIV